MKHPHLTTLVALVAWFGVLLQMALSLQLTKAQGLPAANGLIAYLGYFTVLTNIVVAVTLSLARWGGNSPAARWCRHTSVATGVLLSIVLVGLGYHVLLRDIWDPHGWAWVADGVLHYATPQLCLLHWWTSVPTTHLPWTEPLRWATWPLVYVVYALLRGEWLHRYPYPFLDVAVLGYGRVLVNASGLLVIFLLLGSVLVAISRARVKVLAR
jgi:hypothetical protein